MGKYVRDGHGIVVSCATCGKVWYINCPEIWTLKREISTRQESHKMVYFCRPTHKWKFDDEYDAELERRREEAAHKRHEARRKKIAEGKPVGGRKKSTPEQKEHAEAERAGKTCKDCRYAQQDRFGFWSCSFQYNIKAYKQACVRFRPRDGMEVRCG